MIMVKKPKKSYENEKFERESKKFKSNERMFKLKQYKFEHSLEQKDKKLEKIT